MTDAPHPQPPASDINKQSQTEDTSSSQILKYPQILLEASFDSLLTHSFPSTPAIPPSNMDPAPRTPHPPPSLSESWASISDAEYSHDEDLQSEVTDAGSLIDVHSANDIQSITGEDTPSEDESDDEEHEVGHTIDRQETDMEASVVSKTPAASRLMVTPPKSDELVLVEPEYNERDHVSVKHTITTFTAEEASRLHLPDSSQEGYVGTLHITLSRSVLRQGSSGTFRLLLLGQEYGDSVRSCLVSKVADALVASDSDSSRPSTPSRYHIIPDSFGPGSQPAAAEVIPIDRTLEVESFHSAVLGGDQIKNNVLMCNDLTMDRLTSTWDEQHGKYVVSKADWQNPNLAIMLINSKDSADAKLSACSMMIFAKRHKIPMIVIRTDNDWNADSAPIIFSGTSAQLCIEKQPLSRDSVIRQLPLDLNTFLNLNPAQLGRHIAYLLRKPTENIRKQAKARAEETSMLENEDRSEKAAGYESTAKDFFRDAMAKLENTGLRQILRTIAIIAGTLFLLEWSMLLKSSWNARYPVTAPQVIHTPNVTAVSYVAPLSTVTWSASSLKSTSVPLAIGSATPPAATFSVETLGSSHLVVRTPPQKSDKQKFGITVQRNEKKIAADTRMLFPSVWSVRLEPAQAYGDLKVCFATSKPPSKQCANVTFPEQSFASWMRELIDDGEDRLQQKLANLHESLEDLRQSPRPREVMKEAQKRLLELEHTASQDLHSTWEKAGAYQARAMANIDAQRKRVSRQLDLMFEQMRVRSLQVFRPRRFRMPFKTYLDGLANTDVQEKTTQLLASMHEHARSDTMATSQDRAKNLVRRLQERFGNRR